MNIHAKLPDTGTTIFTKMSALAANHQAINLSQGFPDFPLATAFAAAMSGAVKKPVHQYAPMQGVLSLRQTISKLINRQYQRVLSPDHLLVTAGATQAVFTTIQALVGGGDEVIILDPAYDCYRPAVLLAGGRPVHVPLTDDFTLNIDALARHLSAQSRMIILNNPHNPSGAVFGREQMRELLTLLDRFPDCLILSDEVYEFINFSGEAVSMHYFPDYFDRTITISSFGKTLHATGWKVGYLTAPERLLREIKKVHQFLVFSVNHFAQVAIDTYLQEFEVDGLSGFFAKKRDLLQSCLRASRFRLLPCAGTYFQVIDIREVTDQPDVDFAVSLTKEWGLATIPLSVFYENNPPLHYLRLCFAKSDTTLTEAGNLLRQL